MERIKKHSNMEIDTTYDVVVAGGGLAGVMTAISAAREGLNVLIFDKYGFFGGMATCGLVNPFMHYYERVNKKNTDQLVNGGLFTEMLDDLYALGGAPSPRPTMFNEEILKIVLDRMLKKYNVNVLLHSKLSETNFDQETKMLKSVKVATISGVIELKAKYFVDATGNADLIAFSGLPYEQGREEDGLCQPMSLMFRLVNVDWDRVDRPKMQELYKEFQGKGLITNPRENILCFKLPIDNTMHLNTTRIIGKDPTNVVDLTYAEAAAREQILELHKFMKENIEGMENCSVMQSAPEIGIRESRRIVGHYRIHEDELLSAVKYEDSIARGAYCVDIHNPSGSGTEIRYVPNNEYYTIPYRALVPVDAKNIIVAGRPICSTHAAHSAFRIMPITSCIGEGAGIACAVASKSSAMFNDVNVKEVQNILVSHGALI